MPTPRRSPRRLWLLWSVVLVLSAIVIWIGLHFTESPPPKQIVMATGVAGGSYDFWGHKYEKSLGKHGLSVKLHNSHGSVENLHLLLNGEVDVAFVQGGTSKLVE